MGTTSEKLQAALDSKNAVKEALADKGLNPTNDFSTYAGLVNDLENTSDATATSGDIIEGAVAYTAEGRTTGTFSPTAENITYDNSGSGMEATTTQEAIDELKAGQYTHPAYAARTGVPTANATPGFGGTFNVSQPVSDAKGHITAINSRTITIPNAEATTSAAGLMSKEDKTKLNGIAAGANKYTHPSYTAKSSGLYKVTVDATGHVSATAAVAKSDITALGIPAQDTTYSAMTGASASAAGKAGLVPAPAAGNNGKFLRGDGTWATPTNTTYSAATQSAAGLMSADDKKKLDGVATGANKYTHPSYTAKSSGLYKVTVDATGHVSAATAVTKADITGLGIPAQDTTYSAATASKAGLMSAEDKVQLDNGGPQIVTTAGTGALYTATVEGVTALTTGMKITIVPHTTSLSTNAKLNVNNLGAKYIRQRLSTNSSATAAGPTENWLVSGKPVTLMYNGTYWVAELTRSDANTLYGTVPIANGGTGASTAEAARANLGAIGNDDVVDNLESTATNLPLSANQGRVIKNNLNAQLDSNYFRFKFIQDLSYSVGGMIDYIKNNFSSFENGITILYFQPNGSYENAIISKTSDLYGSVLKFGYDVQLTQYTLYGGVWNTQ